MFIPSCYLRHRAPCKVVLATGLQTFSVPDGQTLYVIDGASNYDGVTATDPASICASLTATNAIDGAIVPHPSQIKPSDVVPGFTSSGAAVGPGLIHLEIQRTDLLKNYPAVKISCATNNLYRSREGSAGQTDLVNDNDHHNNMPVRTSDSIPLLSPAANMGYKMPGLAAHRAKHYVMHTPAYVDANGCMEYQSFYNGTPGVSSMMYRFCTAELVNDTGAAVTVVVKSVRQFAVPVSAAFAYNDVDSTTREVNQPWPQELAITDSSAGHGETAAAAAKASSDALHAVVRRHLPVGVAPAVDAAARDNAKSVGTIANSGAIAPAKLITALNYLHAAGRAGVQAIKFAKDHQQSFVDAANSLKGLVNFKSEVAMRRAGFLDGPGRNANQINYSDRAWADQLD